MSAVVLLAWRRPWRQSWTRRELGAAALFGVVLATMNVVFYIAIDYLPLGTAVAIEFLGPVAVAGVTGRGWRDRVGIALAAVGVVLLAGVQLEGGLTTDVVIGLVAILGVGRGLGRLHPARPAARREARRDQRAGRRDDGRCARLFCRWRVGADRHRCVTDCRLALAVVRRSRCSAR